MRERRLGGRSGLVRDDRAVSVAVGYVLTLAIGAVLLSGVVIGVGGLVDSQTERVVRGNLEVTGQTTVANLESADRLVRAARAGGAGGPDAVNVSVDLPDRVAGSPYRIAVDDDGVTLRTDDPDVTVRVPHAATESVGETTVSGGPIRIAYDPGDDELVVTDR